MTLITLHHINFDLDILYVTYHTYNDYAILCNQVKVLVLSQAINKQSIIYTIGPRGDMYRLLIFVI